MEKLYTKYRSEGLVVLGVHAWTGREPKSDVEKFIKDQGVSYAILLGGRKVHRERYQCKYVPRVFFVDRQGRIVYTKLGFNNGDERHLEKVVKDLL